MNRGIDKETIDVPEQRGKRTKANPIRVDVLVSRQMEARIAEISEAMKLEKAAAVRMLMWFAMRFASPFELTEKANMQSAKHGSQLTQRLDTRITQEMLNKIEELMEIEKLTKSTVIKILLEWALANIGHYTIEDWLIK